MNWKEKILSLFDFLFFRKRDLKLIKNIENLIGEMRATEKTLLLFSIIIVVLSSVFLTKNLYRQFSNIEPAHGGSFVEGIVGNPRLINPIFATTNSEKDIVSLVFAGLLKENEKSSFVNDIAKNYTEIEKNKIYEFELKDNAYFHNNTKITADDIIFTIEELRKQKINTYAKYWDTVKIEKINDNKIRFELEDRDIPFFKMLTTGIVPKNVWQKIGENVFSQENIVLQTIGSGPYKIKKINKDDSGLISSIILESFSKYTLGEAKINEIELKFFTKEKEMFDDYKNDKIDNFVNLNKKLGLTTKSDEKIIRSKIPKIFSLKINTKKTTVLSETEIVNVLDISIPRQQIIQIILNGKSEISKNIMDANNNLKDLLNKNGWILDENNILTKKTKKDNIRLTFSISTSNDPLLIQIANILKNEWEKLGIRTELKIFEGADLETNVIQQDKYDVLLTMQTQEEYEKDERVSIPLFAPVFEYIYTNKIKNIKFKKTSLVEERFANIKDWFIETKTTWQFWKY